MDEGQNDVKHMVASLQDGFMSYDVVEVLLMVEHAGEIKSFEKGACVR